LLHHFHTRHQEAARYLRRVAVVAVALRRLGLEAVPLAEDCIVLVRKDRWYST
jgi:hypothetical protein